jgi:hypothetical protein
MFSGVENSTAGHPRQAWSDLAGGLSGLALGRARCGGVTCGTGIEVRQNRQRQ